MSGAATEDASTLATIQEILKSYREPERQDKLRLFSDALVNAFTVSKALAPHVHSMRARIKDARHFEDKLLRKAREFKSRGEAFPYNENNYLETINDLVGIRILHLHTKQVALIDPAIRAIFEEAQFQVIEGPLARTWDDESRQLFRSLNIASKDSPSLYTSVHYVVGSASRTKLTAEIQVRTLAEEVWGEVDHTMNYPHVVESLACREQLKVLARVTSSATRLVDSIFATLDDFRATKADASLATSKQLDPQTVGAVRQSRGSGRPRSRRR